MEIPEKNLIDEHFLERLRMQRLKQAAEYKNATKNSGNEAIIEKSNDQKEVSFIEKESDKIEESPLRSEDFLHKFNTFDNVIRFSFNESLGNEEKNSYESEGILQTGQTFENDMNQYLTSLLRNEEEVSVKREVYFEQEKNGTSETKFSIDSNNRNDVESPNGNEDIQQNIEIDECIHPIEVDNVLEDTCTDDCDLLLTDKLQRDEDVHPNESFRVTVQPILENKAREFNILGYESVNEDLLWKYLIEKTWKRAKEPYRLHQVVADIYTIRPNDFMNHATVEVLKKSEPRNRSKEFSIDIESLRGLF